MTTCGGLGRGLRLSLLSSVFCLLPSDSCLLTPASCILTSVFWLLTFASAHSPASPCSNRHRRRAIHQAELVQREQHDRFHSLRLRQPHFLLPGRSVSRDPHQMTALAPRKAELHRQHDCVICEVQVPSARVSEVLCLRAIERGLAWMHSTLQAG